MTFPVNVLKYSMSFSSTVIISILKIAKFISVHKDSKLDFLDYCPISLLSNIEKISERLMYNKGSHTFLKSKIEET